MYALFALLCVNFAYGQNNTVEVKYAIPTISGIPTIGTGSGFLLSREKRIFVTAFHVVPNELPGLRDGVLTVAGQPATLLCFWREADVAILHTQEVPSDIQELPLHPAPETGMRYTSFQKSEGITAYLATHDPGSRQLWLPGSISSVGTIINRSEPRILEPGGAFFPTGVEVLITDTPSKRGFSGGPAVVEGKVVGIQQAIETVGLFGYLSSSRNIIELLKRPGCQN